MVAPTLKLDAGVGPLAARPTSRDSRARYGRATLGETRIAYRLDDHGILYAHYGSDLRIDRIEPNLKVEFGRVSVNRWRHFDCRAGRVYRHTTGAKWTAVLVGPREPKRLWRVIVGAGAAPSTCAGLGLASNREAA